MTPVSTATTGAITLNLSTGIHFVPSAALTGNVTFTFSNIKAGQCGIIALQAGSFTVSWGGTMILPGGTAPAANTSGYTLFFYWALNTSLTEGTKAPQIGPSDAYGLCAHRQRLDDVRTATEAAVYKNGYATPDYLDDLR